MDYVIDPVTGEFRFTAVLVIVSVLGIIGYAVWKVLG